VRGRGASRLLAAVLAAALAVVIIGAMLAAARREQTAMAYAVMAYVIFTALRSVVMGEEGGEEG